MYAQKRKGTLYLHIVYVPARDYPKKVATTRKIKIVFMFSKSEWKGAERSSIGITGEYL